MTEDPLIPSIPLDQTVIDFIVDNGGCSLDWDQFADEDEDWNITLSSENLGFFIREDHKATSLANIVNGDGLEVGSFFAVELGFDDQALLCVIPNKNIQIGIDPGDPAMVYYKEGRGLIAKRPEGTMVW